jgi:hypothetical protein
MSKANILKKEKMPDGKVRLTFETDKGTMTYEYGGSSARAVNRGTDPSGLSGGRLITRTTKKDESKS